MNIAIILGTYAGVLLGMVYMALYLPPDFADGPIVLAGVVTVILSALIWSADRGWRVW